MFCHVDLPFNLSNYSEIKPEDALNEEINAFASRTNSKIISKKNIWLEGHPGMEFEMKPPGNVTPSVDKNIGRIYLMGNKLYLLSLTAKEGSELMNGKDQFLNPIIPYN